MFGALQQVVGFYSQKLTVYEINFSRVNGRCQYTQDTDRIILGVPQNINTKKSKIDYDVKNLRSVFDDVISDYCDYKNSKSINKG